VNVRTGDALSINRKGVTVSWTLPTEKATVLLLKEREPHAPRELSEVTNEIRLGLLKTIAGGE